jgi:inorganic triphosphatase YgiF
MGLELELKFLVSAKDAAAIPALLSEIPAGNSITVQAQDSNELLNAYFDTADYWFRRHDMGLRTRQKSGGFEQTIKLAGQQHGALQVRPEYNVPCNGITPVLADFPAGIRPDNTDILQLQQQLTELFRTDFIRRKWLIRLADNTQAELVYDNGLIVAGNRQQAISELELELISGSAGALFQFAKKLVQHLPLRTGWLSKAARGYTLAGITALRLPEVLQGTVEMAGLVQAIQQTEACYWQKNDAAYLTQVAGLLQQLAEQVSRQTTLSTWLPLIHQLAQQAASAKQPFTATNYNLLLLALAEHLIAAPSCHTINR